MGLGWRDAGSTLLIGGAVMLAVATVQEWVSFLSVRWVIVGMTILGVGACAVGAYSTANVPPLYLVMMWALVAVAALIILLGLIFGSKPYAVTLAILLALLWIIATARHAFATT